MREHQSWLKSLRPRPARVFAPVQAPRCSVPRLLPAVAAKYLRPGLLPCGLREAGRRPSVKERAPAPRTSSVPHMEAPQQGHTCQLERLQTETAPHGSQEVD